MKKTFFSALLLVSVFVASAQVDSLQEYTGKYKFNEGSPVPLITVTVQNGGLYASSDAGNSTLTRSEGDVFSIDAFAGVATFTRNTDRKIVGVKIEVDGAAFEGSKTDGLTDLAANTGCTVLSIRKEVI